MKLGIKEDIIKLLSKASSEFRVSFIVILLLAIVFIEKIPRSFANMLSTLYGRVVLFAFVLGITYFIDWPTSILAAVLALLLLVKGTPTFSEGFVPDMDDGLQFVGDGQRWWSEIVLKENPVGIEENKVHTLAVQDRDEENSNRAQDSRGQNNATFK